MPPPVSRRDSPESPVCQDKPCAEEASSTVPPSGSACRFPHAPFVLNCSISLGVNMGPRRCGAVNQLDHAMSPPTPGRRDAAQRGNLDRSVAPLERALSISRTAGIVIWLPWAASTLGLTYALGGQVAEALSLLEEAAQSRNFAYAILMSRSLRARSLMVNCLRLG